MCDGLRSSFQMPWWQAEADPLPHRVAQLLIFPLSCLRTRWTHIRLGAASPPPPADYSIFTRERENEWQQQQQKVTEINKEWMRDRQRASTITLAQNRASQNEVRRRTESSQGSENQWRFKFPPGVPDVSCSQELELTVTSDHHILISSVSSSAEHSDQIWRNSLKAFFKYHLQKNGWTEAWKGTDRNSDNEIREDEKSTEQGS